MRVCVKLLTRTNTTDIMHVLMHSNIIPISSSKV